MAAHINTFRDARCRIELLGTLRVVLGGETLTHFPRQKAARLLTFLALHPTAHLREHLVDLFWPDLDLPAGRDSLSTTLTALRRLLGTPQVLVTTHQTVSLNAEAVTTDAAEFEQLAGKAQRAVDLPTQAETLAQALLLYRSDPCAGMYDDWALRESGRLRCIYTEALRGLTLALEQLGDMEEAQRTAARWAAADPYCEDAHLRVIALHMQTGQSGEARAAAKTLEALWREEFGSALSPAVQSEIAALLAEEMPRAAAGPICPPLPVPLDLFFGRERELAWLADWLSSGSARLATVVGPGGMGKTRLALDFAARGRGRITSHFVSLVETEDAAQILPAIVRALALPPNPEPLSQLAAFFQSHPHSLLILDNLEQLVSADDAAAQTVYSLLLAAPKLSCLCTSRLALGLRGERLLPLDSLPLPAEGPADLELEAYAGVQLYVDRARAVRPDFHLTPENSPAAAAVCRLLDGSPLALELAASWVRLLPPRAMWERLSRQSGITSLETRRSDAPARHHSLRAALDWSWRLLKPAEQRLLARVSVFRGGWTLEAAEAVCGEPDALNLLSSLLEASLVRVAEDQAGQTRYGLLETVRHYARERLAEEAAGAKTSAEEFVAAARKAHLEWCFALALAADAQMKSPEQGTWLKRLEADHDNLRAALDWAAQDTHAAPAESANLGLRLCGALGLYWQLHGHFKEGCASAQAMLARPECQAPTEARAEALHSVAVLATDQGDLSVARALHEEALAIRRALQDWVRLCASLNNLAIAVYDQGDSAAARALWQEAVTTARKTGSDTLAASPLANLGELAFEEGNLEEAVLLLEEGLALHRKGGSKYNIAYLLKVLATIKQQQGDLAAAQRHLAESLSLQHDIGNRLGVAQALEAVAALFVAAGQADRSAFLSGTAAALRDELSAAMPVNECERHRITLSSARLSLGKSGFQEAFQAGRKMNWEQAAEFALAAPSLTSASPAPPQPLSPR